ncbi:MAG: deoxyribonuclease IV [Gammaproteobacteria bacterium]|nr:deoxyribonuclease IV [Gammaproteobacteria bacterium]
MSKYVGAHVSITGGVANAAINARAINAKAFAFFLKNQRQWFAKPYTQAEIKAFKENLSLANIKPKHVLPHSSYLINLGGPDIEKRQRATVAFIDELNRCDQLGLVQLNVHPGSGLRKISDAECLANIADSINYALEKTQNVAVILENTAGQGGTVGDTFEHLAAIIDMIKDKSRIGVCIDTCHAFAAGYDFRTKKDYQKTWDDFAKIIGFEYLKGMHLNDSRTEFAAGKDRHESIGQGFIGVDAFKYIMQDSRMDDIPLILETKDPSIWADEIKLLYSFIS